MAVNDATKGENNRSFVNDMAGRALYATQGGHVQRQLIANGEVLGRYGELINEKEQRDSNGNPNFVAGADFNFIYQAS